MKMFRKAIAAAAITLAPVIAGAEPPSLNAFATPSVQFFLAPGVSSFDVQFLFSRAVKNNSFFYQVEGGSWVNLFSIPGSSPTVPASPPPGNPFTVNSFPASAAWREVKFAICEGFWASFASCGAPNSGPFTTGIGANNVASLSASQWNTLVTTPAAIPGTYTTNPGITNVLGFEDTTVPVSDSDYSDIIIGTSLARVVPEPSTYALMGLGLVAMGLVSRRRRRQLA